MTNAGDGFDFDAAIFDSPMHGADWERWDTCDNRQAVEWLKGVYAAGVAEGIRQAREAVQREYDDDSPIEPPQWWSALNSALQAIDAL